MRRGLLAVLFALLLLFSATARADGDGMAACPDVTAAGAALFEAASGRYIAGKNPHERLPMASTTKVMTALLTIETGDLDEMVEVPPEAVGVEGSSAYLGRGERLTLRDLLYALMLTSGNDAAVTIAMHLDGTVEAFCARMNQRASELGCRDTAFANPNGLPNDAHYTTAYDLGLIAAAGMRNETFREIVSTTYHQTTSGDHSRTFQNKNRTLWQYEGGNGVKTGFTKAAGRCLVFSAERAGMTLVGVALNAPDLWNDAYALLDCGFDAVERTLLVDEERPLAVTSVSGGEKKALALYPKQDILYPTARDGSDEIAWLLQTASELTAPVQAGAACGELTLLINGEAVQSVSLETREGASARTWRSEFLHIADSWTG